MAAYLPYVCFTAESRRRGRRPTSLRATSGYRGMIRRKLNGRLPERMHLYAAQCNFYAASSASCCHPI